MVVAVLSAVIVVVEVLVFVTSRIRTSNGCGNSSITEVTVVVVVGVVEFVVAVRSFPIYMEPT